VSADQPPDDDRPCVLIVDDEPIVLDVTRRLVEHLGYSVDAFSDPMAALVAFARAPNRYVAAITDVMTPGLSGPDLALQLRDVRRDLPIILSTGYAELLETQHVAGFTPQQVLRKPLTLARLDAALSAVLPPP
jgi:two-component system cell cycle sensor histidine kinase/response regulator CckA